VSFWFFAAGLVWFLILEDAGGPSYFNNYQPTVQKRLFMRLQMKSIAAGCIINPQAVTNQSSLHLNLTPPSSKMSTQPNR
jgi:hypothetical protein